MELERTFPAGRHKAVIVGHYLSKSKGGKPQAAINFEGTFKDENGIETARFITWFGSFASEEATRITLDGLFAAGWDAGAHDHKVDSLNSDILEGNECQIVVEHEEYEGTVRAKVKFINSAGAKYNPMEEAEAASFSQKLRGSVVAYYAGKSKPSTAKPPRKGMDFEDDLDPNDIPF